MHNRELNALQFFGITVRHHQNSTPTYTIRWSPTLPTGVTVAASVWSTEDSNLTIANKANDTDSASARFSSTEPGLYRAVNTITDSAGNDDQRWLDIIFKDAYKSYDY